MKLLKKDIFKKEYMNNNSSKADLSSAILVNEKILNYKKGYYV